MKIATTILLFLLIVHLSKAQFQPELPRSAYWGAVFDEPNNLRAGATINSIRANTFLEKLGLRPKDVILKINEYFLKDLQTFELCRQTIRGGTDVVLLVKRGDTIFTAKGTLPARPKEQFKDVITEYKSVTTDFGYNVEVIITRPEKSVGKLPGIFFVRWMGCDPIEKPVSRKHGVQQLLEDLIQKSGCVVIRIEKPGLGDSEGTPCSDADFNQELAAHKAAFKAFRKLDYVDSSKIFLFGQNNGASYAPLVTGSEQVAGYILSGLWSKTWYEHMLEFERNRLALAGDSPAEVTEKMRLIAEFQMEFLLKKKMPVDIVNEKPHLKKIWNGDAYQQNGLTAIYYHQLQELNIVQIWEGVSVPAYILYGEYDYIMNRDDHEQIAALINRNKQGLATFEEIKKMNHTMFWFEALQDAFDDYFGKGLYKPEMFERIMSWIKKNI